MEKSYGALIIPKWHVLSNFKFEKNVVNLLPLFKLTTRKIYDYKEIFFLLYVAKSISFEVISVLKIRTFTAKLIIL